MPSASLTPDTTHDPPPRDAPVVCHYCLLRESCRCAPCPGCGTVLTSRNSRPQCCENCFACLHCGRTRPRDEVSDYCDACGRCGAGEGCECDCPTCPASGGHRAEAVCDNCDRCRDHCDCVSCGQCGERFDPADENYCGTCGHCTDHCDCEPEESEDEDDMAAVPFYECARRFHEGVACAEAPSARFLSCEIEVNYAEDVTRTRQDAPTLLACKKWHAQVVRDGSLADTGFEVCTAPASGDAFVRQLDEICQALAAQRARVTANCGYHVHADARDLDWWDVRRLILLYARIEPALFLCVPRSRRRGNSFCLPCADKYLRWLDGRPAKPKESILNGLYPRYAVQSAKGVRGHRKKEVLNDAKGNKYEHCRYNALNLHSWLHRGTVECRLAAGTVNRDKLVNWAVLWAGMLDFAAGKSEAQIKRLPADNWPALLEVAPTAKVRDWLVARRNKFAYDETED